jgi:competence protein CoiA
MMLHSLNHVADVDDVDKLNLLLRFPEGACDMRYALSGGQRVEAYPGGRAKCPVHNCEVIAKCGTHRVSHWAHRGKRNCDSWYEEETDWHRAGKNNFPPEWQESVQHDEQSGEKHIADVRTPHGLVIEFQHSHLDPLERAKRERFYGNMVWVVDGTRLRRDYPRFNRGKDDLRPTKIPGYFRLPFPEECFPPMWLDSSVPVFFDFRGVDDIQPPDAFREPLWCLLPGRAEGGAVVVRMSREEFVKAALSRPKLLAVQMVTGLAQLVRLADAFQARQFAGMPGGRGPRWRSPRL